MRNEIMDTAHTTRAIVDAVHQSALRLGAEVDIPDDAIISVGLDPDHCVWVASVRFLEHIGSRLMHCHPANVAMPSFHFVLPTCP